jgi:hypothetical protein
MPQRKARHGLQDLEVITQSSVDNLTRSFRLSLIPNRTIMYLIVQYYVVAHVFISHFPTFESNECLFVNVPANASH